MKTFLCVKRRMKHKRTLSTNEIFVGSKMDNTGHQFSLTQWLNGQSGGLETEGVNSNPT